MDLFDLVVKLSIDDDNFDKGLADVKNKISSMKGVIAGVGAATAAIAGTVAVSATYKANDRLWIAASLLHMGGNLATASIVNPWLPDMPVNIDATAFTASMRYRIGKDNFLDIHMTFVDDRAGTLSPLLFTSPLYGPYNYHSTSFGGYFF